jgi:hypothetical protein
MSPEETDPSSDEGRAAVRASDAIARHTPTVASTASPVASGRLRARRHSLLGRLRGALGERLVESLTIADSAPASACCTSWPRR